MLVVVSASKPLTSALRLCAAVTADVGTSARSSIGSKRGSEPGLRGPDQTRRRMGMKVLFEENFAEIFFSKKCREIFLFTD
jgi:hypothetical protein